MFKMLDEYEFKVDIRGRGNLKWRSDAKVSILNEKLIIRSKTYKYKGMDYFLDNTQDISGTYDINDIISVKFSYKVYFLSFITVFIIFTIIAVICTHQYLFLIGALIGILGCTIKNIKITLKNERITIPTNHILENSSIEYKEKIKKFIKHLNFIHYGRQCRMN